MKSFHSWMGMLPNVSLDATGLIALAELTVLSQRTALTGASCLADTFVLCPGIHRQQEANKLNDGEYPICANMNSGYVFRIENQSTVNYLQSIGITGALTTVVVKEDRSRLAAISSFIDLSGPTSSAVLYVLTAVLSTSSLAILIAGNDKWAASILGALMFARLLNVAVVHRRRSANWHGDVDLGQHHELLVILSNDRWICISGVVDHLKDVTSGQWLRDPTFFESTLTSGATVIVYLCAALASNATQAGKILMLVLLLVNSGLLAWSNGMYGALRMKGYVLQQHGEPTKYKRRLHMAHDLIEKKKRKDWAIKLGLIIETNDTSETDMEEKESENHIETVMV
ncbi:MAG: hypothetical protein M1828_003775 [Chrysothrix sp. TS-e1954]|nr:MAG: hypothetical protein M1828_003775 [Chrysothrix sp. TS-e1954]